MRWTKKKLLDEARKVIAEKNLFFIEDVVSFIGCSKPTFYAKIPVDSNEFNEIKDLLTENKVKTKTALRHKMYRSDNPTLMIALYKMIATPEERAAIGTKTDVTSGGKELSREPLVVEIINSVDQVEKIEEIQ